MRKNLRRILNGAVAGIVCAAILPGLFINYYYIPRVVTPWIIGQTSALLRQDIVFDKIYCNGRGEIILLNTRIYTTGRSVPVLHSNYITIKPAYNTIFFTWLKNFSRLTIPLRINLHKFTAQTFSLSLSGQADAYLIISANRQPDRPPDIQGRLTIRDGIFGLTPKTGIIKQINGDIELSRNSLSAIDLKGNLYNIPALFTFNINNFAAPAFTFNARANSLLVRAAGSTAGTTFTLQSIDISSNKSMFQACGKINNPGMFPSADIQAHMRIDLSEINPLLSCAGKSPLFPVQGIVEAKGAIQGSPYIPARLDGSFKINCPRISSTAGDINNIDIAATLSQGKLIFNECSAIFRQNIIKPAINADLVSPSMPFTIRFSLQDIPAAQIFSPDSSGNLSGKINTDITCIGSLKNPQIISLKMQALIQNPGYNGISSALPINIAAAATVRDYRELFIEKLDIGDSVFFAGCTGRISGGRDPRAVIDGTITGDLRDIKKNRSIAVPDSLRLIGEPVICFHLDAPVSAFATTPFPFELTGDFISINGCALTSCKGTGTISASELKLNYFSARYNDNPLTAAGIIKFDEKNQLLTLAPFSIDCSGISLSGGATIISPLHTPSIETSLECGLALEELQKLPVSEALQTGLKQWLRDGAAHAAVVITGPLVDWTTLSINAKITAKQAVVQDLQLKNITIQGTLKDKLVIITAAATGYGGELTAALDSDLLGFPRDLPCKGSLRLKNINLGGIAAKNHSFPNGLLSLQAAYDIIDARDIYTLDATINASINNASITSEPAEYTLMRSLEERLFTRFMFTQASGTLKIHNGYISTDDTVLSSPQAVIGINGSISFNRHFDNCTLSLSVPEQAAKNIPPDKLNTGFVFKNDAYHIDIPVGGTLTDPRIAWDDLFKK